MLRSTSEKKLYPYESDDNTPLTLWKDGKEILTGTEAECWNYIHNQHSFSVSHALLFEGYSIKPAILRD